MVLILMVLLLAGFYLWMFLMHSAAEDHLFYLGKGKLCPSAATDIIILWEKFLVKYLNLI